MQFENGWSSATGRAASLSTFLLFAIQLTIPATANTLLVGTSEALKSPSAAAAVAKPGDVVRIDPGTYFDCAVWTANNLKIEAAGPHVVLTDKVCEGKAVFVVRADNATISGLTFTRARA